MYAPTFRTIAMKQMLQVKQTVCTQITIFLCFHDWLYPHNFHIPQKLLGLRPQRLPLQNDQSDAVAKIRPMGCARKTTDEHM